MLAAADVPKVFNVLEFGAAGAGANRVASGSGLVNLQKRLAGWGTSVAMTVAVHPVASPVMVIGQNLSDKLG